MAFREYVLNIVEFLKEIGVSGLLDITFISLLIYAFLVWFKKTRATFVLTGILIIGFIYLLARQFNLYLTTSILQGFFTVILIAIIVIFQNEIRDFFEKIAVWSLNPSLRKQKSTSFSFKEVNAIIQAVAEMAKEKIGALIVIRGKDPLDRFLEGGFELDGKISEPILISIFDPHSVGHDGAVVIEDGRIEKFSCHLPLSKNFEQLKNRGTRHAAALGLSELTDAFCIVVSEEKGTISVARNGEIKQVGLEQLILILENFYQEIAPKRNTSSWYEFFKKNYKEKAIAITMALALWFVLVHESRLVYKSYSIPVEYTPPPPQYKVVKVEPSEVKVTFLGPRRAFYFTNEKQIRLFIKLPNTVTKGVKTLTISESNLSFTKDLSLENITPRRVKVYIEEIPDVKAKDETHLKGKGIIQ